MKLKLVVLVVSAVILTALALVDRRRKHLTKQSTDLWTAFEKYKTAQRPEEKEDFFRALADIYGGEQDLDAIRYRFSEERWNDDT